MIPTWLVLGAITFLMAYLTNRLNGRDIRWFNQLVRPRWLTFERAIPFIWIFIFTTLVASATLVWDSRPNNWPLMGLYLLLQLLILSYTPVICKLRSLEAGTIVGILGFVLGLVIAFLVFPINNGAFLLLLPYLLWSPIGTLVTWLMIPLNR